MDPQTKILYEAMGEPIKGKTYIADGWVYRDIPWLERKDWYRLMSVIGAENYRELSRSTLTGGKDEIRGQLLISPQGMTNLADHPLLERKKA